MIAWADVIGYEGLYQISTYGNVMRMHDRAHLNASLYKKQTERFGYYRIMLKKGGIQKSYQLHRLVAIAFIPNPDNKSEVNHIDGNSLNNEVFNLEWATSSENKYHLYNNRIIGDKRIWGSKFIFLHTTGHTFKGSPAELKNIFMFEEDPYLMITDDITCAGWTVDWYATATLKHTERVNTLPVNTQRGHIRA